MVGGVGRRRLGLGDRPHQATAGLDDLVGAVDQLGPLVLDLGEAVIQFVEMGGGAADAIAPAGPFALDGLAAAVAQLALAADQVDGGARLGEAGARLGRLHAQRLHADSQFGGVGEVGVALLGLGLAGG